MFGFALDRDLKFQLSTEIYEEPRGHENRVTDITLLAQREFRLENEISREECRFYSYLTGVTTPQPSDGADYFNASTRIGGNGMAGYFGREDMHARKKVVDKMQKDSDFPTHCMRCRKDIPVKMYQNFVEVVQPNPCKKECPHGPFCNQCVAAMMKNTLPFCHICSGQASGFRNFGEEEVDHLLGRIAGIPGDIEVAGLAGSSSAACSSSASSSSTSSKKPTGRAEVVVAAPATTSIFPQEPAAKLLDRWTPDLLAKMLLYISTAPLPEDADLEGGRINDEKQEDHDDHVEGDQQAPEPSEDVVIELSSSSSSSSSSAIENNEEPTTGGGKKSRSKNGTTSAGASSRNKKKNSNDQESNYSAEAEPKENAASSCAKNQEEMNPKTREQATPFDDATTARTTKNDSTSKIVGIPFHLKSCLVNSLLTRKSELDFETFVKEVLEKRVAVLKYNAFPPDTPILVGDDDTAPGPPLEVAGEVAAVHIRNKPSCQQSQSIPLSAIIANGEADTSDATTSSNGKGGSSSASASSSSTTTSASGELQGSLHTQKNNGAVSTTSSVAVQEINAGVGRLDLRSNGGPPAHVEHGREITPDVNEEDSGCSDEEGNAPDDEPALQQKKAKRQRVA
ncbi:unnamed protein product [Amoebophrya sp. A120]|nr:unnamed protein product [Amoebophrya sp. A120]|eukprot:GSA120T00012381001.1